ncbi:MAG: hypothetical protein IJS68_03165 [Clostridia bacterium]|nr:hypothetical protein [Clostridia bacterium]
MNIIHENDNEYITYGQIPQSTKNKMWRQLRKQRLHGELNATALTPYSIADPSFPYRMKVGLLEEFHCDHHYAKVGYFNSPSFVMPKLNYVENKSTDYETNKNINLIYVLPTDKLIDSAKNFYAYYEQIVEKAENLKLVRQAAYAMKDLVAIIANENKKLAPEETAEK